MNKLSKSSSDRLSKCHFSLRYLIHKVLENYDLTVLTGHRTEKEQTKVFEDGKSKLEFPESLHNSLPSLAVDIAPYPIEWENEGRFKHFAGYVQGQADALGIKIRWGGDWDSDRDMEDQNFNDLVHFELVL